MVDRGKRIGLSCAGVSRTFEGVTKAGLSARLQTDHSSLLTACQGFARLMPASNPRSQSQATPSGTSRSRESRIIVLTEIEAMGGAERSVLALCRWLHERGLPHHVVTYVDHVGLASHASTPLAVVQLQPRMRAGAKIIALRRYLAQQKGVHPHGPNPLLSGYQPALHATLAGLRGFHCLMHDTPSLFEGNRRPRLKEELARRLSDAITGFGLRSGGATIVTSEYLAAECRRVFGVEARIARMGGLSSSESAASSGAQAFCPRPVESRLNLLSVSRLESNKRLDWLLRALASLEQDASPLSGRIDWKLHVIGRGSESDTLLALAASHGLGSRVRFHGYVSDARLEELYAGAHLFLMPAVQGYGIPAIEALSRGIPVLLHRDSGVSDILLDTPWATVFRGEEASLLPALRVALQHVITGVQLGTPLPPLPTEDQWAGQVATLCGWT